MLELLNGQSIGGVDDAKNIRYHDSNVESALNTIVESLIEYKVFDETYTFSNSNVTNIANFFSKNEIDKNKVVSLLAYSISGNVGMCASMLYPAGALYLFLPVSVTASGTVRIIVGIKK